MGVADWREPRAGRWAAGALSRRPSSLACRPRRPHLRRVSPPPSASGGRFGLPRWTSAPFLAATQRVSHPLVPRGGRRPSASETRGPCWSPSADGHLAVAAGASDGPCAMRGHDRPEPPLRGRGSCLWAPPRTPPCEGQGVRVGTGGGTRELPVPSPPTGGSGSPSGPFAARGPQLLRPHPLSPTFALPVKTPRCPLAVPRVCDAHGFAFLATLPSRIWPPETSGVFRAAQPGPGAVSCTAAFPRTRLRPTSGGVTRARAPRTPVPSPTARAGRTARREHDGHPTKGQREDEPHFLKTFG